MTSTAPLAPPTRSSSSASFSPLSTIALAALPSDAGDAPTTRVSTPPTSLHESTASARNPEATMPSPLVDASPGRTARPQRTRRAPTTYNLKKMSAAAATRVPAVDDALQMDWELSGVAAASPRRTSPRVNTVQRRPSVRERVRQAAEKVGSVLGKRGRAVVGAGRRRGGRKDEEAEKDGVVDPKTAKVLRELDMGPGGVLDEMDLEEDVEEEEEEVSRPAKKARKNKGMTTATTTARRMVKRWQREGLYVGQDGNVGPKLQKRRASGDVAAAGKEKQDVSPKKAFMPLPMFDYLEKTRDFVIPFDIYAPSLQKGDEKPKDWHKVNRNRVVGEAKELWEKEERLPTSRCVCRAPRPGEQGCEDDCLNRVMQYECNPSNCALSAGECSNRAFSELAARTKKGGAFDIGVEVVKTADRGFGVRSCRAFAPGQIIMEYTGEIISEAECQRRMREDYQDNQCYYLMELERGLIIDGTRGSMARFINHSCAPNCDVRMLKVNGAPRMAVFAGDAGLTTGDELTYDYNFDNFGTTAQLCHCRAPTCRGFLSKRLNASETKRRAREDEARKAHAAAAAAAAAQALHRKPHTPARGPSWRGWVAVDDPDTKARLLAEKAARDAADRSSARAQRMAARRQSAPSAGALAPASRLSPRRRRTVLVHNEPTPEPEPAGPAAATEPTPEPEPAAPAAAATIALAAPSPSAGIVKKTETRVSSVPASESETTRLLNGHGHDDDDGADDGPAGTATATADAATTPRARRPSGAELAARRGKQVLQAVKSASAARLRQTTLQFGRAG